MSRSTDSEGGADEQPGRTADLLAKARVGDQVAWRSLHDRYRKRLIIEIERKIPGFALRRFDAEDVIQIAFSKVHEKLPKFQDRGPGSFRSWLSKIVSNECVNLIKVQGREREHRTTESQGGDVHALADGNQDRHPDAAPRRAELLKRLEKLSQEDQEIIIMVNLEKLTWAQIAEELECSRDTARNLYEKAIERLERLLDE